MQIEIVWSPVNQAWFVMFGTAVLRVFGRNGNKRMDKAEAEAFVRDCTSSP